MLKFEKVCLMDTLITFNAKKNIQMDKILKLLESVKITHNDQTETLQFVPLECFANPNFHDVLVTYNNAKFNSLVKE
uniref:Uncharacterized protein n=1 Tax=Ditylenchus dipsaci TaxID=166011 RepID=A0A915E4C3_9BILA